VAGFLSILIQKEGLDEKEKPQRELLPFLNFLTFSPVGNPLAAMLPLQRQFFFESMLRQMHLQRVEGKQRTDAILGQRTAALSASIAGVAALRAEAEKEKMVASLLVEKRVGASTYEYGKDTGDGAPGGAGAGMAGASGAASSMRAIVPRKKKGGEEAAGAAAAAGAATAKAPVSAMAGAEAAAAAEKLALVIDDYARGDEKLAKEALQEFDSRLKAIDYKADDLMAMLLIVIEDQIWAGEEGEIGGAKGAGSGMKIIPEKLRETVKESAEARLASVREMLRYYFDRNPHAYPAALAAALGITADQEGDVEFLQERLAYEIARVGSFALAQKILAAAKEKRKMDTKKCLLELGYFYDKKKKKLVIGKRTCGKPAEARGIISVLLAGFKKPN